MPPFGRHQAVIIEGGDFAFRFEALVVDQVGDLGRQPAVLAVVLQLDLELDLAAGQRDHLRECGDPFTRVLRAKLAAEVHLSRLVEREVGDPARVTRNPHQVAVVEHDHDAVGGLLDVELGEVGSDLDRLAERAQRVLRSEPLAAAMSHDDDRHIDGDLAGEAEAQIADEAQQGDSDRHPPLEKPPQAWSRGIDQFHAPSGNRPGFAGRPRAQCPSPLEIKMEDQQTVDHDQDK